MTNILTSFLYPIFHKLEYCLQQELKDCRTVLDLGCGPSSPLKHVPWIKSSTGVEIHKPYLVKSKKDKIHTKYINGNIEDLKFTNKSFDAVLLIEVIEHLTVNNGLAMIKKAEKWAKKKVIITSPNGFLSQTIVDNNPYQKHLSGWDYNKLKSLGYISHGLAGFKIFRHQVDSDTMGNSFLVSIRYKPKLFWFIVALFSQLVSYHLPQLAFGLFSVKKNEPNIN